MSNEILFVDTEEIVTPQQFRRSFPNKSFPRVLDKETLREHGAEPVLETPKPNPGPMYVVRRDGVKQDEKGNWVQNWVQHNVTELYDQERLNEYFNSEKYRIKSEITSIFKEKRDSGINVDFNGKQVEIQTNHDAQLEVRELVNFLSENSGTQKIATRSGSILNVDLTMAEKIKQSVANHISSCWNNDANLRESVELTTSLEELYNIDIQSGWPT